MVMQYINKLILLVFLSIGLTSLVAQETLNIEETLNWEENSFDGAFSTEHEVLLPLYMSRLPLASGGKVSARLVSTTFENFEGELDEAFISEEIDVTAWIEWDRRKPFCKVSFIPLRKGAAGIEQLTGFTLAINFIPSASPVLNTRDNTYTSVLSDGEIYKISVEEYGIHKLDYDFLNSLGIDMNSLSPKSIRIYGNGGGKLPAKNSDFRHDDLVENAIFVSGENDGSFDQGDYVLFYGEGAEDKTLNEDTGRFSYVSNPYDNNNYYFIKINSGNGLRISNASSINNTSYTSTSFNDFQRLEENKSNLLKEFLYTTGSGSQWFGDKFDLITERNYNFNFDNISPSSELAFEVQMVARKNESFTNYSYFTTTINGQQFQSTGISGTTTSNIEARYAHYGIGAGSITSSNDNVSVSIEYDSPGAEAWLDYININARRELIYAGTQLTFRDLNSLGQAFTTFQLSGINNNIEVWDITNPLSANKQETNIQGNQLSFGANTNILKEYIAFDKTTGFKTASPIGIVNNQNLHSIDNVDALLVYHKDFEAAALTLKEHRESHSNITVAMAEIDEIFNEFSSGAVDPVAIRDMVRMLYERSDQFKYLILLGDGSFDYKNTYNFEFNSNFIPVYETIESLAPIDAFPTDDYFALLSDNEGDNLRGALDIAVGRIPVASSLDANKAVQKIIDYDTSSDMLGDWRTRITYVADDEDGDTHLKQAERISTIVDTTYHDFNINKIYFDAFQQESSAGGNSYPDASASINSSIFKGQLVVNYLGHGGPTSWAQERVLQITDINSWQNYNKLPLFVTATCTFAGYDDPEQVSAGEKVYLKGNGGAIALFSTVRAVLSNSNERLTKATFNTLFEKIEGEYPTIGEILRLAKNSNAADTIGTNARKFALIGDPTLHLAIPIHDVLTTGINGQPLSENDTISALEEVTISGIVADENGNIINNFNGTIFPTVYDKSQEISTLANDSGSSVKQFKLQKNIIFKGAASVTNGNFTFSFVVPKDIDYNYGFGRISYYAHDGTSIDATGSYEKITIGGTADNPIEDDNPPLVEVFMNDEEFVFGGVTNTQPIIYVKLSDDFGINVAGTGIGHDLTAILDDNDQDIIILNDFYEAEVDDFKKGEARYPLNEIEPGRHTLRIKGWDIANNSGEGYTEFVVAEDANIALEHVLNYPNPFTTSTEFQFEHNLAGQMARVQVQVFTVSGKLVKTITEDVLPEGNRITGIQWDGTDDYGDKIGRGVYLYKITLGNFSDENINQSVSSEFEKLVILK
jgi:hypothetical protein